MDKKKPLSEAEFWAFKKAIDDLAAFVDRVHKAAGPYHQSYLRSLVNGIQPMLGIAMLLAADGGFDAKSKVHGATFDFAITDAEQLNHYVTLTHRAFYSTLGMTVEAMCKGYCEARGASVKASRAGQPPAFADYLNSALAQSKLTDERKAYWRAYFDGVRILRNKSAHYDTSVTLQEREALHRAGLDHHVGGTGHMWTEPANYLQMVEQSYAFIKELDA